ncbi:MAG TPA: GNAT family N-acetyltransferase [Plantibacter sp.]|uniref:GNAT family N-acetyltransferase n=1 Tax=unclassified Plantibacter TaxID=2624265 RepID=UPI002CDE0272|nr:GNAT family N-acetyltransferase [Plantibacter sp.]
MKRSVFFEVLPIIGDDLMLRPLEARDAQRYVEGSKDPAVRAFGQLPLPEYTTSIVHDMSLTEVPEGLHAGRLAILTIADKLDDTFLGSLVLFDVDMDDSSAEVGFWVHPGARGAKVALRSLGLAKLYALKLDLSALRAAAAIDNLASQAVLLSAGFSAVGHEPTIAPNGLELPMLNYRIDLS